MLRWQGYDGDPEFVRRRADLGLIAPSTVLPAAEAEMVAGESGEAPAAL